MDLDARYELIDKIGSGSFATVYRARDKELGREVAVKQIHQQYLDDPQQLARYWQEAQLLASLGHPNVVTIFDIQRERGWLILELMQGNLAERMAGRQMDLRALKSTLAHCLRALKYLHGRGVVHGDIKPSNMMIDARKRVKLGDFGLARRVSDEGGSLLKGTTKYMAPETVSDEFGEVGPASDLYSLGFAAYELMCGSANFETLFPGLSAFGRNKQIAWMTWHAAPDRRLPEIHRILEGVPEDLARVIEKLCRKDQSQRYQSADDALADLNVRADTRTVADADAPETDGPAGDDPARKRRLLLLGGALALSLLLSIGMLFLPGGSSSDGDGPREIVRVVSAVLAEENSLKVEDLDGEFAEKLDLGPRPRIRMANTGRNILLEEIQPGDRLVIATDTDEDGRTVRRITVLRPVASQGRITGIDPRTRQITVAIEEGDRREELPLRVTDRTRITINGKPAGLRDLKVEDAVGVRHVADPSENSGRVTDAIAARRLTEGVGFVDQVDAAKRRLIVKFHRAGEGSLALPFAEDAEVLLQRAGDEGPRPVAVDELQEG
ncbi:MAG: serine/threonine protein kinase, partial [Planctomycetaceae bacterium]